MALNIKILFPLSHPTITFPDISAPYGSNAGSMDLQQEDIRHDLQKEAEQTTKFKGKKRKLNSKSKINIIS